MIQVITKEEILECKNGRDDNMTHNEYTSSGLKVSSVILRPISWRFDIINSVKFNNDKFVTHDVISSPDGPFLFINFMSEDIGDLIIDYIDKQKEREIKLNNIIND